MSVVTAPLRLVRHTESVPWWRRMAFVTWTQHKTAFVSLVLSTVGIVITMLVVGQPAHAAFAAYARAGCTTNHPTNVATCIAEQSVLNSDDALLNILLVALRGFPLLVGMFLGAPLLAKEFETGTFRFAWTQGIGRVRWLTAKLALLGAATALCAFAASLAIVWWCDPFNGIGFASRWQPGEFDMSSVTLLAWILFSLALGVCAGAFARRVLPAMAIAMALLAGAILVNFFWLNHWLLGLGARTYEVVATRVNAVAVGALNTFAFPTHSPSGPIDSWLVSGWLTSSSGRRLSTPTAHVVLSRAAIATQTSTEKNALANWLLQHHYQYWLSYQPAGRYWIFQAVEGGALALAALLIVALAVWAIDRPHPSRARSKARHRAQTTVRRTRHPTGPLTVIRRIGR